VDYRNNSQFDYTAGPLSPEGVTDAFTCANWDRHFRVTGAEIAAFQIAPPLNAAQLKSQFPAIAGWPSRGNPSTIITHVIVTRQSNTSTIVTHVIITRQSNTSKIM
jgi:hypothetical protein